jgi:dephospho-CoA kinase
MIKIGLTGGFGSGKSLVAGMLKKLGARVIDADALARDALKKGSPAYRKTVAAFGKRILGKDGSIDRKALAGIVFSDKKKLRRLERIVHPAVIRHIKGVAASCKNGVLVVDAPLIYEAGIRKVFDAVVVVNASRRRQIERCVKKFGLGEAEVRKRMACQMPLEKKMLMADHIIDNNGTRKETEKQVTWLWQELKKGATVWR